MNFQNDRIMVASSKMEYNILLLEMSNKTTKPFKTFRLGYVRRKIDTLFQSPALKAALLSELDKRGDDAALVVEMVERVKSVPTRPVQAVAPQPHVTPVSASPPRPTPTPPAAGDGSSQEEAVEIMDSENELIHGMTLTLRRVQRVRR